MMKSLRKPGLLAASITTLALALSACGERADDAVGARQEAAQERQAERQESPAAGDSVRTATSAAGQDAREEGRNAAEQMRERTDTATDRMGDATSQMGAGAREPSQDTPSIPAAVAASRAGDRIDDMQITTRVNAGLAADKDLSAMRIDVDTKDGIVTLMGTAPSATAKARASEVAREIKDVRSVNNQLTVGG